MFTYKVMFAGAIAQVFLNWGPYHVILFVFHLVADVKISHFCGAGALFLMVTLAMPSVVVLSH